MLVATGPASIQKRVEAGHLPTTPQPGHSFVSADEVRDVAEVVQAISGYTPELELWRLFHPEVHPGIYRVREQAAHLLKVSTGTVTLSRHEGKPYDKDSGKYTEQLDPLTLFELPQEDTEEEPQDTKRGTVSHWSRKSRANMAKTLAQLDYTPWMNLPPGTMLGMVTLTLPGDWLTCAPTGGHFKKHLQAFRRRWVRAIGEWSGIWKLEFQRRGAPHFHLLMPVPAMVAGVPFEQWLSLTWADIVSHPNPLERAKHERAGTGVDFGAFNTTDPRRIAVYFQGHSAKTLDSKEYQHIVPEPWQEPGAGPGRFWGYSGLERVEVAVEIHEQDFYRARRIIRKVQRARQWDAALRRHRWETRKVQDPFEQARRLAAVRPRGRKPSTRSRGGGFVLIPDGPAFAVRLAQHLSARLTL